MKFVLLDENDTESIYTKTIKSHMYYSTIQVS